MKRFFAFIVMMMAVGSLLTVKADPTLKNVTYTVTTDGLFDVRCNYYDDDSYVVAVTGIADYSIPEVVNLVFPGTVHAVFENFDLKGHDLEDDFAYSLVDFSFSWEADAVIESIEFAEGIEEIPGAFFDRHPGYSIDESMWEDYELNQATVLKELTFAGSVKSIGIQAFAGHVNLEKITFIGDGLETIGNAAFLAVSEQKQMEGGMGMFEDVYHGALTELVLPSSVKTIGQDAFLGQVNIKELKLPYNIETIGENAFGFCGIETLSANVPYLTLSGSSPFQSCPIKKLIYPATGSSEGYTVVFPEYLMKSVTSKFSVEIVPEPGVGSKCFGIRFMAHSFDGSHIESFPWPDKIEYDAMYPSIWFGEASFKSTYYFKNLDLASVLCDGDVEFENEAFIYSSVENVTFNNRTKRIGESAFENTHIKKVELPMYVIPETNADGKVELYENAFYNCQQLTSVRIEGDVNADGAQDNWLPLSIFESCKKLETIELPTTITTIGNRAFADTNIKIFSGWEDLEAIYTAAFANCKSLETVGLANTKLTTISEALFQNTPKLKTLSLPEEMLFFNEYAFDNCGLETLDVPAEKTSKHVFINMPNLKELSFVNPKSETIITEAIVSCPELEKIDFGVVKTLNDYFIDDCPKYVDVVLPDDVKLIYKDAFKNIKDQIKSVTYDAADMSEIADIADAPFAGYTFDLILGEHSILPAYLFAGTHITNSPDAGKINSLHTDAFLDAVIDSLDWHFTNFKTFPFEKADVKELTFSEINTATKEMFKNAKIDNINLSGIETIEESAFESVNLANSKQSNTLIIPASVKTIGKNAFSENKAKNLLFEAGEGLTVGEGAFSKAAGTYETIITYYDKDNIPTLDEKSFQLGGGSIGKIYAGSCDDVDAYKAADVWKDLDVAEWEGQSVYKCSFEIVGEQTERPIEYYNDAITLNGRTLSSVVFIGCDNKAEVTFTSPCTGITFDHWNDPEAKDPMKYGLTLTSDTVIKIYVNEKSEKIQLTVRDEEEFGELVKLYFQYNKTDWVEQSEAYRNDCGFSNPDSIKMELLDPVHYYFYSWYTYDAEKVAFEPYNANEAIKCPLEAITLYAGIRKQTYTFEASVPFDQEMYFDHFVLNGVEDASAMISETMEYNEEVELLAVGASGAGFRYVLDYWYDNSHGLTFSSDNPLVFNMPDEYLSLEPHFKPASKFTITAKSSDDALGTVMMNVAAEDKDGEQIWEQAKIDLKAEPDLKKHAKFVKWEDETEETVGPERTVYATKNFEYVAVFEKDSFNINVTVEGINPELVTIVGADRYGWGDEVTITFENLDEHYDFVSWTYDETTFTNTTLTFYADKHADVIAKFEAKTYSVNVIAVPKEGGKVTVEGSTIYNTLVKLKAEPNEGYLFTGWEDDGEAPAEREVLVEGDATYTAFFAAIEYKVTFKVDEDVYAEENVKQGQYAEVPDDPIKEGYDFTGWDPDPTKAVITQDTIFKAQFTIKTFTVKFFDREGNLLDVQTVKWNEAATAPDDQVWEGHIFNGWDEDFEHVKSDLNIHPIFDSQEPKNLNIELTLKEDDILATFSWDAVESAASYEMRFTIGEFELTTYNTKGLSTVSILLSEFVKLYDAKPGKYFVDWAVRSLDDKDQAISIWAKGESFQIEVKGPGTGVEDVQGDKIQSTKVLRNGVILIERNGQTYDLNGRLVK